MITIETLTGDINLTDASAKCFVFHTPRKDGVGHVENHLGLAADSPQTQSVVGKVSPYPVVIPSVQGFTKEIGGKMVRMTYQVAEGEVIKVFVTRRPGAGKLPVSASLFLRVRSSAALREVKIKLVMHPRVAEPFGMVRGRFDVLTLEEAKALGVPVAAAYDKFFGPGVVAAAMEVVEHAPEVAAAITVTKTDGTAVVVVAAPPRRRALTIPKK